MDVRKATSSQIQPQTNQKSEVIKTKAAALNPIADSFEKENSKSSSSNSSSASSGEPEKKAGQITGGILIKQITAARLGGTNASGESSGKKQLTPEQQSRVSNFDPRKQNLNPSFFLQDARSKDEDRKNFGLQPPFASNKGQADSRFSKVGKDQIIGAIGQNNEQTSNAVKDADRLADGGSVRTQVDAEVAERHQDSDALGGSRSDRLNNLLNPTASGPQQSSQAGKDQLAYTQERVRNNGNGTSTKVVESADEVADRIIHSTTETTSDDSTGKELEVHVTQTVFDNNDNSKIISDHKRVNDANGNVKSVTDTSTTTKADGTVIVETSNFTVEEDGKTKTTTTKDTTNPDGSTKKETTTEETTPPPAGGAKSYNQENYAGNIPDAVKKTMDYFRQQVTSQKPSSGGETAHTDDNAAADSTVGGRVSNLVVQQGSAGLLGNPGSADLQTGLGGAQSPVGSSQSGGNVDFDQDSGKSGYTGPTHEDDPSDVQFGPAEQPKAQTDTKKSEDTDDSSASDLDPLHKKRRDI